MSKYKKHALPNGDLEDDDDFDAFLKESLSSEESTVPTGRIDKFLESPTGRRKPSNLYDISDDDDDEDESDGGLMGTGKMFLKKKTSSKAPAKPAIKAPEPAARNVNKFLKGVHDTVINRDSLEDDSYSYAQERAKISASNNGVAIPELNLGASSASYTDTITGLGGGAPVERNVVSLKAGKETLDEMAEKEKFFKALEQGDNTVDYSRLNRELDQDTFAAATLGMAEEMPEEEEEMSVSEEQPSGYGIPPEQENDEGGDQPMLDKVALMDSLDSSLGSKPTASRDRGMRDMQTIHESHDDSDRHGESEEEGLDEPDAIVFQASEYTDTHGVTMKTQTGFGDTSRGVQKEYQNAIGLGTADGEFTMKEDSSTYGGKSSMFNTAKTHDIAGTLGSDHNQDTPEFALKPMPATKHARKDERTADDLIRQVKEFRRPEDRPSVHFNVPHQEGESDGFDMSPRQSFGYKSEEPSALELSPIAKHHDSFNKSHFETSQGPDSSAQQESTPIAAGKGKAKVKARFAHIRSSGYGQKKSSTTQASHDLSHLEARPEEVRPPLTDSTESMRAKRPSTASMIINNSKKNAGGGGVVHNEKLMSSIVSLVAQLQGEITSRDFKPGRSQNNSTLQSQPEAKWSKDGPVLSSSQRVAVMEREQQMVREVKQWQEQWKEERKIHAKLKVDLDCQEKYYTRLMEQMKIDHEKEIFQHKQENFVLSAKIADDAGPKPLPNGDVAVENEQIKLMEKEIREQEKLLAGYQQENERIYQELKTLQQSNKGTETKMFKENQRLQTEVSTLREEIARKDLELKNKGLITSPAVQQQIAGGHVPGSAALGANRIAQLESKLKSAMRQEGLLYQEIETHKEGKVEVERQMEALVRQMGDLDSRLTGVKSTQSRQDKARQTELEKEVEKLQKKVKWYAENQDLLDKDKHVILAKDEEIRRLRTKVNGMSTESGRRVVEMRSKAKERSLDAKRIQDLERQVKEMENILKKRHPDSIPMMIWAANHLPDDVSSGSTTKPASVQFLESRLAKLERELEDRDEEAKVDIRVLEQKYSAMKLQYEERIHDLEDRLARYERPGDQNLKEGQRPHSSASAIQRELDSVRDRSKKEAQDLRTEIEKLKKENNSLRNKEAASVRAESRNARDKESDQDLRVRALQLEVSNLERDKQFLKISLEKAQKEKQQIMTDNARQASRGMNGGGGDRGRSARDRRPKSAGSVRTRSRSESRSRDSHSDHQLPPYTDDYTRDKYEPGAFAGQHVSDILRENEELKIRVERLQLDAEQQRVNLNKVLAESEDRERRLRENNDDRISALKTAHQNEIQRLFTEHAMSYSTSKVAELTSKVDTQEVAIKFLKDQLQVARADSEQLATFKIREAALETQVKQFADELREARQNHTPEMRHFHTLTDKITQLESRHGSRERELQQIIQQTRISANADFTEEVERWKRIVDTKNLEIERFKTELDSILEVLKELQRQGVLLPYKHGVDGYPSR